MHPDKRDANHPMWALFTSYLGMIMHDILGYSEPLSQDTLKGYLRIHTDGFSDLLSWHRDVI